MSMWRRSNGAILAVALCALVASVALRGRSQRTAEWFNQAATCAPCHGGDAPDGLYAVWRRSPWADPEGGRTCQSCHSPEKSAPECGSAWEVIERAMSGEEGTLAADLRVTARRDGGEIEVEAAVVNTGTGHSLPGSIRNTLAIEIALRARAETAPAFRISPASAQLRPFATAVSTFHLSDPERGARHVVVSLWLEPVAELARRGERRHLGTEVVEVVP